eukprot:3761741-Prymnesium_polylepis.2
MAVWPCRGAGQRMRPMARHARTVGDARANDRTHGPCVHTRQLTATGDAAEMVRCPDERVVRGDMCTASGRARARVASRGRERNRPMVLYVCSDE